jgi:hypothetical protein
VTAEPTARGPRGTRDVSSFADEPVPLRVRVMRGAVRGLLRPVLAPTCRWGCSAGGLDAVVRPTPLAEGVDDGLWHVAHASAGMVPASAAAVNALGVALAARWAVPGRQADSDRGDGDAA